MDGHPMRKTEFLMIFIFLILIAMAFLMGVDVGSARKIALNGPQCTILNLDGPKKTIICHDAIKKQNRLFVAHEMVGK